LEGEAQKVCHWALHEIITNSPTSLSTDQLVYKSQAS